MAGRDHSRPWRSLLTVALLVALAACSGGKDDDAAPTPSTEHGPYVVADASVRPLLPTVGDLPGGLRKKPIGHPERYQPDAKGGFCGGPDMLFRAGTEGLVAKGRAQFETRVLPKVGYELYELPTDAAATALMAATAAEAQSCPSFRQRVPEFGDRRYTLKTTALPFPAVGDQTVALRQTYRAHGRPIRLDVVHVRVGRYVAVVTQYGDPPDAQLTERLVAAQVDKLR